MRNYKRKCIVAALLDVIADHYSGVSEQLEAMFPVHQAEAADQLEGEDAQEQTLSQSMEKPTLLPRVPTRLSNYNRWLQTWLKVKSQWDKGDDYYTISVWLRKMHPKLYVSPETLADIIKAGAAGMLQPVRRT